MSVALQKIEAMNQSYDTTTPEDGGEFLSLRDFVAPEGLATLVIGKQKCNDFGKMICSKIGNNGTMFSATRVQYYWQQSCSTSKGSIFLIDSSFFK